MKAKARRWLVWAGLVLLIGLGVAGASRPGEATVCGAIAAVSSGLILWALIRPDKA